MKINGWDIEAADALQWNVTFGFHSISNNSEWSRGSPVPVLFKNELGFKTMKVTILVKRQGGRQAILARCSEILSHLIGPAELELDDFAHKFYGILAKHTLDENPLSVPHLKYNRVSKLTLEFSCYEYATQEDGSPFSVSASGATIISVSNPGNIFTPAVIEITPQIGAASITITGICRDQDTLEDLPVTVQELESGKTILLDGESGLFTQDGAIKTDLDIWALPTLLPGDNRITINNDRMDTAVRFRPRFM